MCFSIFSRFDEDVIRGCVPMRSDVEFIGGIGPSI